MYGYTVDVDALDEVERQLEGYQRLAGEKLRQVDAVIARLGDAWQGAGGTAYESRHRDWARALGEMKEQLGDLKKWAHDASAAYREVMDINTRMARG